MKRDKIYEAVRQTNGRVIAGMYHNGSFEAVRTPSTRLQNHGMFCGDAFEFDCVEVTLNACELAFSILIDYMPSHPRVARYLAPSFATVFLSKCCPDEDRVLVRPRTKQNKLIIPQRNIDLWLMRQEKVVKTPHLLDAIWGNKKVEPMKI